MRQQLRKSAIVATVAIVLMPGLAVGCGRSLADGTPVEAAAFEYRSSNVETIITGPDGQRIISNSADGSLVTLDGGPYQPMMGPDSFPTVSEKPSAPVLQPVYNYGPVDTAQWDLDGNLIAPEGENPHAVPPGLYTTVADGAPVPDGAFRTLGGTVLVPVAAEPVVEPMAVTSVTGPVKSEAARLDEQRANAWRAIEFAPDPGNQEEMDSLLAAARQADEAVRALAASGDAQQTATQSVTVSADDVLTAGEADLILKALDEFGQTIEWLVAMGQIGPDEGASQLRSVAEARKAVQAHTAR